MIAVTSPVVGAVILALTGLALLRLHKGLFTGRSKLVTPLVTLILLVAGLWGATFLCSHPW